MIEKLKRKEVDRADRNIPENIEQLILTYSLDSVWEYIDAIIDEINKERG